MLQNFKKQLIALALVALPLPSWAQQVPPPAPPAADGVTPEETAAMCAELPWTQGCPGWQEAERRDWEQRMAAAAARDAALAAAAAVVEAPPPAVCAPALMPVTDAVPLSAFRTITATIGGREQTIVYGGTPSYMLLCAGNAQLFELRDYIIRGIDSNRVPQSGAFFGSGALADTIVLEGRQPVPMPYQDRGLAGQAIQAIGRANNDADLAARGEQLEKGIFLPLIVFVPPEPEPEPVAEPDSAPEPETDSNPTDVIEPVAEPAPPAPQPAPALAPQP
jgi:hypothetical protein